MSLSSLPSIPKIKNEFTEILIKPKLLSIPTTSSSTFIPVITETSFLKPKIDSLHIPTTDLVEYYNQMFPTLDTYQNFVDQKLHLWHSNLKLKYFDSMYQHQRATTKSIKRLRTQAQKLLEEADSLQEQKTMLQQEISLILANQSLDNNFIIQLKYILDPLFLVLEKSFLDLHALHPILFALQTLIILSNLAFFAVSNVIVLTT